MTNPARRLYVIFRGWREAYSPTIAAYDVRGFNKEPPNEAVEIHLEVFRLLASIRDSLNYLESKGIGVATYQDHYPQWLRMALHVPNGWTGGSDPDQGFPPESMAHLDTLATLLDVDRPSLHAEPEARLRRVLNEVFELLRTDDSLSDQLREYVYKLANEIRQALDDEAIMGTFDFATAAERLWVAVYAAAGQSQRPGKWKAAAKRFWADAAAGAIGSAPSVGLTMAQITGLLGG